MVVLATSVCTKNGKGFVSFTTLFKVGLIVLVSRQFVNIPRSRMEGLLAAFPKLLGGSENQQHTFIETASVRYLYQRFEDLFLVVITNKSSNIVEDLETLRILTKVVPEYCGSALSEKGIVENGFELIFAFDEVVSLGYKESVTLDQIRTFTELDSHEEKIHEMIEKNKEREAHEEAKRRMKEIDRDRREREKMGLPAYNVGNFGSVGPGGGRQGISSGNGTRGGDHGEAFIQTSKPSYNKPEPQYERRTRKGLQLGKKPQAQGLMEQIHQEGETAVIPETISGSAAHSREPDVIREAVEISIIEQISCAFDSDGSLQQMQIMGEFLVNITEEDAKNAQIAIDFKSDLQSRVHPSVNRELFAEKGIISTVVNKSYPLEKPTAVLKWRHQTTNDREAPFRVSVWPSVGSDAKILVTVEYELSPPYELSDATIRLHIVGKSAPLVSIEQGSHKFDTKNNILEWNLPLVNRDNPRGSMELEIEQWDNSGDTSWLFPVEINFSSTTTFCNIQVLSVTHPNGSPIPFSEKKQLQVHQYTVTN